MKYYNLARLVTLLNNVGMLGFRFFRYFFEVLSNQKSKKMVCEEGDFVIWGMEMKDE